MFHSHSLKSMSLNLGAKRVIELSSQLEDLARLGKVKDTDRLADELEKAFQQTEVELSALRDQA